MLLVLEVNNLDLISTLKYMHEATSLHFDCVQAHSGQMLMPATHFSLGAATAGLLPSAGTLTYPKDSAYTRIVLQQLLPAPVRLRLPTLDVEISAGEIRLAAGRLKCTPRAVAFLAQRAGDWLGQPERFSKAWVVDVDEVVWHLDEPLRAWWLEQASAPAAASAKGQLPQA
jgi:hypothetical protein